MSVRVLQGVEWVVEELNLASRARAYELARRGVIPCVRIGKLVRFDPLAIDQYKRAGGRPLGRESEQAPARGPRDV